MPDSNTSRIDEPGTSGKIAGLMTNTLSNDVRTLAHLRAMGRQLLASVEADAGREADVTIATCLGVSRAALIANDERVITESEAKRALDWLTRRADGEPLAYVSGEKEFWSLSLRVDPSVLVPRPETELVVERVLALLPGPQSRRVADLGTGSGAIALALATERAYWRIVATDRSPAALDVARRNALRHGLANVTFAEGSWFAALSEPRFDAIASNPPYIDGADPALDTPALRREPQEALTPGGDGLGSLRTLVEHAPSHLVAGGWLVLEHGAGQAAAVAALLVARGFSRVRCHPDLAGLPRVTEAQFPA